jgi:hypothetical protein
VSFILEMIGDDLTAFGAVGDALEMLLEMKLQTSQQPMPSLCI